MILSVDGVSFLYQSRSVLNNVCFDLGKHEVLAILGPNGVGKTTLLRCINTVLTPNMGTVCIEGDNLNSLSRNEIARRLGYVPQKCEIGRITVFDAILMGRKPHLGWQVSEKDLRIVQAAIERLELSTLSLRYLDQMSGGELQKVGIARALVQEPRLMLLDEPTSSLDLKNQLDILATIRYITQNHDVSVVMTMHDLNLAFRYLDRFIFLKEGSIYAAGTREEITAEIIEQVYNVPVEIGIIAGQPVIVPLIAS